MPCIDDHESFHAPNLSKKVNELTDMLCRLMKNLEFNDGKQGVVFSWIPTDILEWWKNHKAWDKKRKENK
jgi:hypothetical protein